MAYTRFFSKLFATVLFVSLFSKVDAQNCSVNAGVSASICEGNAFELEGGLTGLYDASTIFWTVVSEPGGAATSLSPLSSLVTNTNSLATTGSYEFELSVQCADGLWATQSVTNTVLAIPSYPTISYTATSCVSSGDAISITGSAIPGGSTGQWTVVSGIDGDFDNENAASTNFRPAFQPGFCPDGSVRSELRWTITNALGCARSRDRTLTYSTAHGSPTIAPVPDPICGSCVTVNANCAGSGTGTWSVIAQPSGSPAPTITDLNDPRTTFCNLEEGSYEVQWSVAGGCAPGAVSTFLNISTLGSVTQAIAGDHMSFCEAPATVSLSGNMYGNDESGSWSQVGGPALTIDDVNSPNTTVTGFADGQQYLLRWEIVSAAGCYSDDTVVISTLTFPLENPDQNPSQNCSNWGGGLTTIFSWTGIEGSQGNLFDTLWVTLETISATPILNSGGTFTPGLGIFGGTPGTISGAAGAIDNYSYTWAVADINERLGNDPTDNYMQLRAYFTESALYRFRVTLRTRCETEVIETDLFINYLEGISSVNAGTDQVLNCAIDTTILSGNSMTAGGNYMGYWTVAESPVGSPAVSFDPDRRSQTPTVSNLSPGRYRFRLNLETGFHSPTQQICDPLYDDVEVIVANALPDKPDLGPDLSICNVSSYDLVAPTSTTGIPSGWTQIAGPSTVSFSPSASDQAVTVSSLLASSTYRFVWTDSNGCGANRDTIDLVIGATVGPSGSNITTSNICSSSASSFGLSATAPATGTGTWSVLSGPGSPVFSPNTTTNNVTVSSLTSNAVYRFLYTVAVGGCANVSTDTVTVYRGTSTTYPDYDDVIVNNCDVSSFPYTAEYIPDAGTVPSDGLTYNWQVTQSPFDVTFPLIDNADSIVPTITYYAAGQYIVSVDAIKEGCDTSSFSFLVSLSTGGDIAVAGVDTTLCGTSAITLYADAISSGTGLWTIEQVISGDITITFTDASLNNTAASLTGSGVIQLAWNTYGDDPICGASSKDYLVITSVTANAGYDQVFCGLNSIQLDAALAHQGSGSWSMLSGPNTPSIVDNTAARTAVTGIIAGTYTFRWSVTAGSCTVTDDVEIDNTRMPSMFAGWDYTNLCYGATEIIDISAHSLPSGYTGLWTVVQVPGAIGNIADDSQATTTYSFAGDSGMYVFNWEITDGGACTRSDVVNLHANTNTCGSILPLELIYFSATALPGQSVLLNWLTETVEGISRFDVQYSNDGLEWETIGSVAAEPGKSVHEYSHIHTSPIVGYNYYRLLSIDFDGEEEYSEIKVLNFQPQDIKIFPNPSLGVVNVKNIAKGEKVVKVYNHLGADQNIAWLTPNSFEILGRSGPYIIEIVGPDGQSTFDKLILVK